MKKMKNVKSYIGIVVDSNVKKSIVKFAEMERRSMTQYIIWLHEQHMKDLEADKCEN